MIVATRPRLAFLGLGFVGRWRLESLEAADVADVVALADPALPDCLDSLEQLLELQPDGVVISTPNAFHAEQAITALAAGVAVFCQKPLGVNASEAGAVVDAARQADRLLGVDLSYRHTEAAQRVRELVQSGALGEVVAADLVFHNAYGPKEWAWRRELSGGGCVLDLGVHLVDLALWTLGHPRVVGVESRLRRLAGGEVEDYALALLELETGALVRVACSWSLDLGRDCAIEATFHGTDGGASVGNVDGSFFDFRAELRRGAAAQVLAAPPDEWPGRALLEWTSRLAAGERYDGEAERHVVVAEVLDRIYEAAR